MNNLKHAAADHCSRLLRTATRVSKAVASILDPDELLRRVVDLVGAELGYHYVGVYLLDETGQWAIQRAVYTPAAADLPLEEQKLAVGGNTLVGLVTRLREARLVADLEADEETMRNPHLHLPDSRSELALPLMVGEDVQGALAVQSTEPSAFTQEDVSSLQAIADQVALAVKSAQVQRTNQDLVRRAERRARLFQAANAVGQQVASILDLDQLLPRTVDIICEAYGFYYAGVFLIDDSGRWAVLRAGHGEAGAAMLARGHRLEVGGLSMVGTATRLREARIALDVGAERVHFKNPLLPHTRSEMALPLVAGDKVLGAVTVQSVEERAFSPDDILTLQTMADHLAIAINNALLLRELDRAHTELLQTKTYEALSAATTQAIHWIGNKALPMTSTLARLQGEATTGVVDVASLSEDLDLLAESTRLIVAVKEQLLGPAREQKPRAAFLDDLALAAAFQAGVPVASLTVKAAPDTPLVLGDTTQLTRALANLFQNALEASAQRVTVTLGPAEGGVMLTLVDDGVGIPPELLDPIWAAFVTTKAAPHTGLGLAACLHVVSQHHGRIALTSEPGRGTTIHLWLPARPATAVVAPPDFIGPPVNILVIDDDDPWSRFAAQTLVRAGKRVVCSTTIEGAAQADAILVDEALRAAPLADILRALAANGAIGKTVVVTTALSVERTTTCLKSGVKDVQLKPYTAAELSALLVS
jgi:GAF domain-containing protein/CheY-like chemotaxis protein